MKPKAESAEIELHPDGWQRFERAMAAVVKSPPKHRKAKAKAKKPKSPRPKRA